MSVTHFAHSANRVGRWEPLSEHLQSVAQRAAQFASSFDASKEAEIAGLLHDIGKYGDLFQRRLHGNERGIDHWSAGAWLALLTYRNEGVAVALAVHGHHVGLQQGTPDALRLLDPTKIQESHPLSLRLSEVNLHKLLMSFENDGLRLPEPGEVGPSLWAGFAVPHVAGMFDIRMLFSVLVDADFLETEAHFASTCDETVSHRKQELELNAEWAASVLSDYLDRLARESSASQEVKQMRRDLLTDCLRASSQTPGLFTLTAPTGSGKTLSLFAFALNHALRNHLRRIVVVIPYLSIIEQTAAQYRSIFSRRVDEEQLDQYILEHHSLAGIRAGEKGDALQHQDPGEERTRLTRLLSENWDAPVIVTTSVQFLESLFSNRPSACRKLHRLAKSIIIFDEVQTLPTGLAIPSLAALSRLAERYGSSVVFSSATQPAFSHLDDHVSQQCVQGWRPREITATTVSLFERSRRTQTEWPSTDSNSISWRELAFRLAQSAQGLCVVNLKRHALALYHELSEMEPENLFHLSTNMCPAHRRDVLDEVRMRLDSGRPCRLISTQCVEAGVDLDFPVVFRALGPLDAVAQAAGRCNRNGKARQGTVYVFLPEDEAYPDKDYRRATSVTRSLLQRSHSGDLDIHSPDTFDQYYRELYNLSDPQNANQDLLNAIKTLHFPEVARRYRVIAKDSINVVVHYRPEQTCQLEEEVRTTGLTRRWIARARPHAIGLFRPRLDAPLASRLIPIPFDADFLTSEWYVYSEVSHYDPNTGLVMPDSPECFIA